MWEIADVEVIDVEFTVITPRRALLPAVWWWVRYLFRLTVIGVTLGAVVGLSVWLLAA